MRRSTAALRLFLVAVLAATLSACSAGLSEAGEPLTAQQAEELAAARFRVYTAGPFTVSVEFGEPEGVDHATASLTVDPEAHRAWGEVRRGPEGLAIAEEVLATPGALVVQRDGAWRASELSTAAQLALRAVFTLVSDRPENATLLRQSDAAFLGSVAVDGERFSGYRLPSSGESGSSRARIWLAADGSLHRLDAGEGSGFAILVTDEAPRPLPSGAEEVFRALEQ